MLKRLIDFVAASTPERHVKLALQDIALCQLWLGTQSGAAGESQSAALAAQIDAWTRNPDREELNTAGRRHQFLLRELIGMLQANRHAALTSDETAFLCTTYELIHVLRDRSPFSRVEDLLEGHVRTLASRPDAQRRATGLATLERRIQYVTEADIRHAPPEQIRLLAGIEMPCRGPVFKATGNLRVLGDVPENCTVLVENDGACCVDGYVMGRVLAKRQCEVRHNIAGVAIVLAGHVRARGIINNALVIAKMGRVVCRNAQGPKLVFAGKSIEVAENTMLGRFVTRDLAVGEEVRGSLLEIAGEASARRFRHLGMSSVSIVLRRELSCEDFGEVTGPELNHLLSRAHKLRRRARNFSHIAAAARHEADHTAQSVLMFAFGGGEVQKRLEGFLRAQRRHGFVSQVVDNLQGILESAREGMPELDDTEDEFPAPDPDGDDPAENDDELRAARADAAHLKRSLRSRALDKRQATLLLEETRQKRDAMILLQARMAEQVAKEERAIQNIEKYEQILAGSGGEATKLDVLNKILPALESQPPDSTMGKRLRSSFVVRALRTIDRATRHAGDFEEKAATNLRDFHAVSEQLGKDFQIRMLENPEDEMAVARVTGRFDSGTRIYMDQRYENLAEAPKDAVITTPEDDSVHTYVRNSGGARFYSAG